MPKSAFIPQKVGVKQLSHKASKVFQFPESQIHLQSIIQGKLGKLGFVRTLRNLSISSCDPLLHHGAKERINVSQCFSCNAMNRSKYEEQEKQKANENETNSNLNYQISINILLVVLLAAPSGRTRVQHPASP